MFLDDSQQITTSYILSLNKCLMAFSPKRSNRAFLMLELHMIYPNGSGCGVSSPPPIFFFVGAGGWRTSVFFLSVGLLGSPIVIGVMTWWDRDGCITTLGGQGRGVDLSAAYQVFLMEEYIYSQIRPYKVSSSVWVLQQLGRLAYPAANHPARQYSLSGSGGEQTGGGIKLSCFSSRIYYLVSYVRDERHNDIVSGSCYSICPLTTALDHKHVSSQSRVECCRFVLFVVIKDQPQCGFTMSVLLTVAFRPDIKESGE